MRPRVCPIVNMVSCSAGGWLYSAAFFELAIIAKSPYVAWGSAARSHGGRDKSSSGEPTSATLPAAITTIFCESRIVFSRWALREGKQRGGDTPRDERKGEHGKHSKLVLGESTAIAHSAGQA